MQTAPQASRRVTVLGLGAVGLPVARALALGKVPGLSLHSVAASSRESARRHVAQFPAPPEIVDLGRTDAFGAVVVECLPPARFAEAALPVVRSGRTLAAVSVGGLLRHPEVIAEAGAHGARILVPSGAIGGLDAVRALCASGTARVELITEKPVTGFEQSDHLTAAGITLARLRGRACLYEGPAAEGVRLFPKNVNVVAALALAGVGAERTRLSLWADPDLAENRHTVRVAAGPGRFQAVTVNLPDPDNPRTSALTPYSVIACLGNAFAPLSFA